MSSSSPESTAKDLVGLAALYEAQGRLKEQRALTVTADAVVIRWSLGQDLAPGKEKDGNQPCQNEPAPARSSSALNGKASIGQKLLSLFLFLYLGSLALIMSPPSLIRDRLVRPIAPTIGALGLWQAWIVFAPDVHKENFHLLAVITFDDGTMQIWEFPRQEKLSGMEKMRAERFRKWANDRVRYANYLFLLSDAARFIARLYAEPKRQPAFVDLAYLSAPIPAPRKGLAMPLLEHTNWHTFFVYKVQPGDFQ